MPIELGLMDCVPQKTINKESAMNTACGKQQPSTKLDLVYAIKDLVGETRRGVLEVYEFEAMRKHSLIVLYEALKVGRVP
ncbi:MAG: hypothetical protein M1358_16540 [Chloroflexi bacterium]|nr:hypothetical protein [Chloroflexota bacterium]